MPHRRSRAQPAADEALEISNLEGLLTGLQQAGDDPEKVSIDDICQHLGQRAYGPILAVAALPSLTPIATIPLLPTVLSGVILLTAGQMLVGMQQVWLPERLLRQSLHREQLNRIVGFVLPAARLLDRVVRPRLAFLTKEPAIYLVGVACLLLALLKPPLELVPFTGGIPAFPILLFGVAISARDGLLVLITLGLVIAGSAGLVLLAGLLL